MELGMQWRTYTMQTRSRGTVCSTPPDHRTDTALVEYEHSTSSSLRQQQRSVSIIGGEQSTVAQQQ